MEFQLVNCDQRFVLKHTWVYHHGLLWTLYVCAWFIFQLDRLKRRSVVIEENSSLLFNSLHQSGDAENFVSFSSTGAARNDQLFRAKLFEFTEHSAQSVWLCYSRLIVGRGPGVVWLYSHNPVADEWFQINMRQSVRNCFLDLFILRDN